MTEVSAGYGWKKHDNNLFPYICMYVCMYVSIFFLKLCCFSVVGGRFGRGFTLPSAQQCGSPLKRSRHGPQGHLLRRVPPRLAQGWVSWPVEQPRVEVCSWRISVSWEPEVTVQAARRLLEVPWHVVAGVHGQLKVPSGCPCLGCLAYSVLGRQKFG